MQVLVFSNKYKFSAPLADFVPAMGPMPMPVSKEVPLEYDEEAEGGEYLDETQVYLRSKFFESWLWIDVSLPSETDKDG